jgi:hypothetical protein
MNKQANGKAASGSKEADKALVRKVREVVGITTDSLPKDQTDGETTDFLQEIKIGLRAVAKAQLEIGALKKAAGLHLAKVRQERALSEPGTKKVMVPKNDLDDFEAWKAEKLSRKEGETST